MYILYVALNNKYCLYPYTVYIFALSFISCQCFFCTNWIDLAGNRFSYFCNISNWSAYFAYFSCSQKKKHLKFTQYIAVSLKTYSSFYAFIYHKNLQWNLSCYICTREKNTIIKFGPVFFLSFCGEEKSNEWWRF